MKTFTVPAGGGNMTFWTSFNTEADWDHLFVEIHTVGQNNWTTLPDANGHTTQATGSPCPQDTSGGWRTLHPWLDHYQTQVGTSSCVPTGTTGAWNAASGDSHGWQQWRLNLAAYAGQQVEVSISYASDWASQGLGVFVDDIVLPDGTSTSFETGLDGWTMPGQPAGKRSECERLHSDRLDRVPGGCSRGHARHDLHGLRLRGHPRCQRRARTS